MITIKRTFCPGRGMIRPEELTGYVFSPEAGAHTFIITKLETVDGQETAVPFAAGADISCRFIKADGVTELVDGDLTDDGKASVTLSAECYQVPGRFILSIYAETSEKTICIYSAASTALAGDTEEVNVSGNTKRTIDAQIDALNDAVENAQETVEQVQEVIDSIPQDYTALSDSVSDLKSAMGVEQSTISTDESEPYNGYWGKNKNGIVNRGSNSRGRTLENPIDISSLSPGVKVSVLSSVNGNFGVFITDVDKNVLDSVDKNNAVEKGYFTDKYNPQLVTLEVPQNAKYIMSSIWDTYYTGMSDFDVTVYDDSIIDLRGRMADAESGIDANDERIGEIESAVGGGNITITPQLSTRKNGSHERNAAINKLRYGDETGYYSVEPIDISNLVVGTQLTMKASLVNRRGIFITDSGLNVLDYVDANNAEEKGYTGGSIPQLITLEVPQNAKYITSDIRDAYYTDMSDFAVSGTMKDNVTLLRDDVNGLAVNGNVLSGKKWVACGDSFTAGSFGDSLTYNYTFEDGLYAGNNKVYPYWIGRRNPFMTVVNEAISGSTMTGGESGVNPFSGARYQAIPSDADYITLMFGINDSGNSCPIGTIDDNDNTTFYGAWNVVLGYFMEHFPFAHIGIIIGPGMQTTSGKNYANAEIAIAKKWGIPYLNIQFESGGGSIPLMLRTSNPDVSQAAKDACNARQFVNPSSETPNYHPNEYAHEFESTFIEAWLRTL